MPTASGPNLSMIIAAARRRTDCVVPRHGLPVLAVADHRLRHAIRCMNEVPAVATLDAQMALVHRRIEHRPHGHDASLPDARRAFHNRSHNRDTLCEPPSSATQLMRRSCRAGPRSGRCRRTRRSSRNRCRAGSCRRRANLGPVATVPRPPDKSPGHLFADPHTTETVDAPRHVHVDARMRIVDQLRSRDPASSFSSP